MKRIQTGRVSAILGRAALLLALAGIVGESSPCRAQSSAPAGYQAYSLKHLPLDQAAAQLKQFLQDNNLQGNVALDRQQNRLLVGGAANVQSLAAQMLTAVDRPAPQGAVATEVDPVLQAYQVEADQLDAANKRLQAAFPPRTGVRVSADGRTNQLLVLAPPAMHRQIATLLQQQAGAGEPPRRGEFNPAEAAGARPAVDAVASVAIPHRLRSLKWNELENGLLTLLAGRAKMTAGANGQVSQWRIAVEQGREVNLSVDRARGEVTFNGTPADVMATRRLIAAMDQPPSNGQDQTRILPVNTVAADASQEAAKVVRWASQFQNAPVTPVAPAGEPVERRIRWGGDVVARLFQQPDAAAGNAAQPPANNNQPGPDGNQPAGNQPNTVPGPVIPAGDATGLIGSVQIEFVEGLDVIILRGNKRDVDRVAAMIAEIERLAEVTEPLIEVYQLKHVGSEQMADLVSQVYDEVLAPRTGPVSITALVKPNAILLVGRAESVETVRKFIDKLDQEQPPTTEFAVIRLKHMSALSAETFVAEFLSAQQAAAGGAPGAVPGGQGQFRAALGTRAKVVADPRSNAIVVFAGPRDLAEVRKLVERLDVVDIERTNDVKVFKLKNSLAEELQPVLENAILGQGGTTAGPIGAIPGVGGAEGDGGRALRLDMMMINREGGPEVVSGILTDVIISADPRSNALIVTAPTESMPLIEALIEELDKLPSAEATIKVFTIVNGDATILSQMLQEMFGITQTGGGGFGGNTAQVAQQTATGAGDSSLVNMRFSVDARSNSIIASGTSGDLEVVEAILLRLDDVANRKRQWTVYQLNNSPAQSVADAVTQLLSDQRTLVQQTEQQAQLIPALEIVGREVIVIPEIITNSILISATPQYYDQVMDLVKQLDRRPPMVRIDVLIAEVALDDLHELGFEFGLQDSLLFDRGIGVQTGNVAPVGFPFNNLPLGNNTTANPSAIGTQGLSSFGVGRASPTAGFGGLVFSASSESVNVLVRALQQKGKVQILSRPQITTMDNIPGSVLVGQIVSRIRGTTQNAATTTQDIEDIEVGLLLDITPRVAPDGLVTMAVNVQNRSLDENGVLIPDGAGGTVLSPNINTTDAETTVAARSGQTIVMSGLIVKSKAVRTRGVPVISDLPFVGPFFRFDTDNEMRSELLIIMTPTIIEDDQDIEWLKQSESERMNWCLADVVEVYGDQGLVGMNQGIWNHEETPVIFPHETPSLENWQPSQPTTPDELHLPTPVPPPPTPPGTIEPPRTSQYQPTSRSDLRPRSIQPPPARPLPASATAEEGPLLTPATGQVQAAGYYPPWPGPRQ